MIGSGGKCAKPNSRYLVRKRSMPEVVTLKSKLIMVRLAAVVAIMIVGMPLLASASAPAVGTADTSITLLGLSYRSSGAGVTHTINVAVSSGIATTDPVRNNLSALKASTNFIAAHIAGVSDTVDERHGDWAVSAEAGATDGEKNSTNTADDQEQINETAVKGDVTATAMYAEVDPRVPSAKATATGLNLDLVIGEGDLIALDDVRANISDDSNPTSAKADQSVSVSRISLVPLKQLLDRVGGLSPEALLALAGKWGNETTQDQVAIATAAAAPLLALTGSTSLSSAISLANTTCALLSAAPVCALVALLQTELDTLLTMFSATGIVDITNLTAGVTAEAFDSNATAKALAGYESIFVLGREVTQTATLDEAFAELDKSLNEMKDDFSASVAALSGLTIEIDTIFAQEKTGTDGSYQTASASVAVLRFLLELPSTSVVTGGFSAQATAGDPLSVDARVLTLAGDAEHRPAIVDVPGGGGGGGGGPLANTGLEETILLSGLALMGLGLRVRRWLGDAA